MGLQACRIDVRDILEDLGGTRSLNEQIEIGVLTLGPQDYLPLRPAHVVGTITNTGTGLVLDGSVDIEVTAVCSRCLEEFPLTVTGELEGFYVAHGHEYDLPEEQEVAYVEENGVDILEPVLSALALAMPFAPVHAEDCPGICATCGADLAAGSCTCAPDLSGSPFAALKDIFEGDGSP